MAIAMNTLLADRREDGTALITINSPDKPGTMNHAFLHHLPRTLAALDEDPEIRACVITGAEGTVWDGGELEEAETPSRRRQARLARAALRALQRSRTVTIGVVSGLTLGIAEELMLACDVLVASTRASFGEEIGAEEALRAGLVQRVVAPEDLMDEALSMAGQIACERGRPHTAVAGAR